jgi:hypothetical protein
MRQAAANLYDRGPDISVQRLREDHPIQRLYADLRKQMAPRDTRACSREIGRAAKIFPLRGFDIKVTSGSGDILEGVGS